MDTTPFVPQDLPQLLQMSPEDLTILDHQLSREFTQLSKQYMSVRLLRIEKMLASIALTLKQLADNEEKWTKIYTTNIDAITTLKTKLEDLVANDQPEAFSVDAYEHELDNILRDFCSPKQIDPLVNRLDDNFGAPSAPPPFAYLFDQVFAGHKRGLAASLNERKYQVNLVNNNATANRNILWMQYYREMSRRRRGLIDSTESKLVRLHHRYHQVDYHLPRHQNRVNYYRSTITPRQLVRSYDIGRRNPFSHTIVNSTTTDNVTEVVENSRDTQYANQDLRYLSKNRIEVSDLRKLAIASAPWINRPLSLCTGLSKSDVEEDLALITGRESTETRVMLSPEATPSPEPSPSPVSISSPVTSPQPPKIRNDYLALLSKAEAPRMELPVMPSYESFVKTANHTE